MRQPDSGAPIGAAARYENRRTKMTADELFPGDVLIVRRPGSVFGFPCTVRDVEPVPQDPCVLCVTFDDGRTSFKFSLYAHEEVPGDAVVSLAYEGKR